MNLGLISMNVFWREVGKKFTILGTILIAMSLYRIFTTENTLEAALLGFLLSIFGYVTIKSAMGWSRVRYWKRQREQRRFQYQ